MKEKEYFTRKINIDISVATIGINRDDWYSCKPGMTRNEVRQTMLLEKYDVVPIINKKGGFESYFKVNKGDNTKLDVLKIEPEDRLYYLTHVRDAIWIMKKSRKTHFFLSNHHDENDIVGLLSLSNFNCREFLVYLFSIISYIEKEFSALIESDAREGYEILEKKSQTVELKDQLKTIRDRFEQDQINENENNYKEYLYLHHLIWLAEAEKKYESLNYRNSEEFGYDSGKLKDLRNIVAHPVKSLVRNLNDLDKLYIGLNKLYEYKERLEMFAKFECRLDKQILKNENESQQAKSVL